MNDDLISRQAAISVTWNAHNTGDACRELRALPSAQPERKKGEWIKKISKKIKDKEYIGYTPYWYCSECGTKYEPAVANTIINYCYNCGAEMGGDVGD